MRYVGKSETGGLVYKASTPTEGQLKRLLARLNPTVRFIGGGFSVRSDDNRTARSLIEGKGWEVKDNGDFLFVPSPLYRR